MIKYTAFIRAIETGSITKAAKSMGYSQPALSYMIDSLEKEVGFPLLIRTKDGLQLTDSGRQMLPYYRQLISAENNIKSAANAINGVMKGAINIGGQNSMLINILPTIIGKYSSSYSNVELEIQETPFADFPTYIKSGKIDIGFSSQCNVKGCTFHPMFRDTLCLIMNKNHPLAKCDKISVESLLDCDFIMPLTKWNDTASSVLGKKEQSIPNTMYYTSSDIVAISIVSETQSTYIMSTLHLPLLPQNIEYRYFDEDFHRVMGYIVRDEKIMSPAMSEFIRTSNQIVREKLSEKLKDGSPIIKPL